MVYYDEGSWFLRFELASGYATNAPFHRFFGDWDEVQPDWPGPAAIGTVDLGYPHGDVAMARDTVHANALTYGFYVLVECEIQRVEGGAAAGGGIMHGVGFFCDETGLTHVSCSPMEPDDPDEPLGTTWEVSVSHQILNPETLRFEETRSFTELIPGDEVSDYPGLYEPCVDPAQ